MITKSVISKIYKIHRKPPKDIAELKIPLMIDCLGKYHKFTIEGEELVIDSLCEGSPFHRIIMSRILGIEYFDRTVAIILPSCILFFAKCSDGAYIHIRPPKLSIFEKLSRLLRKKSQ